MLKKVSLVFLILFCTASSLLAQDSLPVFQDAMEFYKVGQYDSTIHLLRNHLRRHGRAPETEIIVPLIVEAYIRNDETGPTHRLIGMYRQRYPESSFLPRLAYLEGVALVREKKFDGALGAFSNALALGVNQELDSLIIHSTEKICREEMGVNELSRISSRGRHHPRILEIARFLEISKLQADGQEDKAKSKAEEFRKLHPFSRFDSQIGILAGPVKPSKSAGMQIGLMAPLSGDDADIGRSIVQGVELAIQNSRLSKQLNLVISDTKGNMVETVKKSKEMLERNIPVVIGPVLSYNAVVSASLFMDKDIVMISPTATDEGIAGLGDNIFQMNITLGMLGQKIARYAVENMNISDFAIIAPRSPYGTIITEHFKNELKRHGARIVHEEYFEEGIHDFTPHLINVREKLILNNLEKVAAQRGSIGKITKVSRADSVRYSDSTLSVGGLFMPVEPDDVVMLAPQAIFHRLRTQMLGTSGWHTQKTINDGKRYVNNAIIATSFQIEKGQKMWQDFEKSFRSKYNSEPDRIAALGYDAAQLVISAIEESGGDIQRFKRALSNVENFHGLSGVVSFDRKTGANTEAAIMKVTEKGFIRVH